MRKRNICNPKKYLIDGCVPDIISICNNCHVDVCVFDSDDLIVSGINSFYRNEHNKYIIYIRHGLDISFTRFLASYMLSCIYIYGEVANYVICYQDSIYDRCAYSFALDLLLPNIIKDNLYFDDLKDLANKYKVSENLIIQKRVMNEEKKKFKVLKMEERK